MHKSKIILFLLPVLFLGHVRAFAYDEAGHYAVVYAIARTCGYSVEESSLIANASQSLDDNDATTAFSFTKLWDDKKNALDPNNFSYLKNGQVFHSLANDDNRALVEQKHIERIMALGGSVNTEGMTYQEQVLQRDKRNLSLIYLGQYLHLVADEIVHPRSTTPFGHGGEGHEPDHPENDPEKLAKMMLIVKEKLEAFKTNDLKPTTASDLAYDHDINELTYNIKLPPELKKIGDAVISTWHPSSEENAARVLKKLGNGEIFEELINNGKVSASSTINGISGLFDYTAVYDKEKEAMITTKLRQVLGQMDLPGGTDDKQENLVHQKIILDENGNPSGDPIYNKLTVEFNVNNSFNKEVASLPWVVEERNRAYTEDRFFEYVGGLLKGLASGPGGVALDPNLVINGEIGEPQEITISEQGIILVTSTGKYLLEGVSVRSFATILNTISNGEIPFITIGSLISNKPGYQRVIYSPSLIGTQEGNTLYRADIQFKALLMSYPFGKGHKLNGREDPFFSSYPGQGGEGTRFWITSQDIEADLHGDHLVVSYSGMRINSETTLQGCVTRDPELEEFAERLTSNWDRISADLPEFKEVEKLAFITSFVIWARNNHVKIDPLFWNISPKGDYTPTHVATILNTENMMYGGVSLTPEDKDQGLAHGFQWSIISKLDHYRSAYGPGWGKFIFFSITVLIISCILLGFTFLFWLFTNWSLKNTGKKINYSSLFKFILRIILLYSLLLFLFSPITFGDMLSNFDKRFIAFFTVFISAPVIYLWQLKIKNERLNGLYTHLKQNRPFKTSSIVYFSFLPVVCSFLFCYLVTLPLILFDPTPSTRTVAMVDKGIIPAKTFALALEPFDKKIVATANDRPRNEPFALLGSIKNESDKKVLDMDGIPTDQLLPVEWNFTLPDSSRNIFLSIDGKQPY